MNKKLLISGCSYGVVYSEIQDDLKKIFNVDEVVNISQNGGSPDRAIRVAIEWIAQNGKPDMLILPVSHYNRFDLPIAERMDPLHNLHFRSTWHMDLSKNYGSATPIDPKIYHTSITLLNKEQIIKAITEVINKPILVLYCIDLLFLSSLPIVIADVNVKLSIVDITIDSNEIIKNICI